MLENIRYSIFDHHVYSLCHERGFMPQSSSLATEERNFLELPPIPPNTPSPCNEIPGAHFENYQHKSTHYTNLQRDNIFQRDNVYVNYDYLNDYTEYLMPLPPCRRLTPSYSKSYCEPLSMPALSENKSKLIPLVYPKKKHFHWENTFPKVS